MFKDESCLFGDKHLDEKDVQMGENKYYTKNEIKEKFKSQMEQFGKKDNEYDIFCLAICALPKEIVDTVEKEIYFIFDDEPWYLNLESKDLTKKKGIIFVPLHFLTPENTQYIYGIHHEIAHHILGHKDIKDEKDKQQKEAATHKLTFKWDREYFV